MQFNLINKSQKKQLKQRIMKKLILVIAILFASCSSSDDDCMGTREEITQKYNELIEKSDNEEEIKKLMVQREDTLRNACD